MCGLIVNMSRVWSEAIAGRSVSSYDAPTEFQWHESNAISSFEKVGTGRLLDHMYFLPLSSDSIKFVFAIKLLNSIIIPRLLIFPVVSEISQIMLKSPMIIHGYSFKFLIGNS